MRSIGTTPHRAKLNITELCARWTRKISIQLGSALVENGKTNLRESTQNKNFNASNKKRAQK